MPTAALLFLAGLLFVNLAVGAALLWVCCLVVGIRHAADEGDDATTRPRRVGIVRSFFVTAVLGLIGAAMTAGLGWAYTLWPSPLAVWSALAVTLAGTVVLPLLAMRALLPGGFLRHVGAYLLWNVLAGVLVPLDVVALWLNAEAFVVPTGAMAETVLGHHKQVRCPSCALSFAVNASAEAEPADGVPPVRVDGCVCPNCRQHIVLQGPGVPADVGADLGGVADPGITTGDRIVSGKWLLGAAHLPPRRFDPVVFDWPGVAGEPKPTKPIRYIMRLVGLPGEMLAIHRGDLFALPREQVPPPPAGFAADEQAGALFAQGKFRVLRKSPGQVLALMRLVHDADHRSRVGGERWVGPGWQRQDDAFVAEAPPGGAALVYRHLVAGPDRPQLITDYGGYNTGLRQGLPLIPDPNWASDLILECEVSCRGEGSFRLELARGPSRYHAVFDFTQGQLSLERHGPGKELVVLKQGPVQLPQDRWVRLRFANVDEQLLLWVDERLPFDAGVEYDGPAKLAPLKENDLDRPAAVHAAGLVISVRRVKLYRDTYYTTARLGNPANADVMGFDPGDATTWAQFADAPVATHRVSADHYFFLGDNSQQSSDSRSWGLVPRGNLNGRVFLRYWPPARAGWMR